MLFVKWHLMLNDWSFSITNTQQNVSTTVFKLENKKTELNQHTHKLIQQLPITFKHLPVSVRNDDRMTLAPDVVHIHETYRNQRCFFCLFSMCLNKRQVNQSLLSSTWIIKWSCLLCFHYSKYKTFFGDLCVVYSTLIFLKDHGLETVKWAKSPLSVFSIIFSS